MTDCCDECGGHVAYECFDSCPSLRRERDQLRAEVERLRDALGGIAAEVKEACETGVDVGSEADVYALARAALKGSCE